MSLGTKIRTLREAAQMSQEELGAAVGRGKQAVSDWENEKTGPNRKLWPDLARALRTTVDYLLEDSRNVVESAHSAQWTKARVVDSNIANPTRESKKLPVISWVQAGEWATIVKNFESTAVPDWVECPFQNSDDAFVLQVAGPSMLDPTGEASFRDGDYISVDPKREATNRSFVVVKRPEDASAIFRQLLIENDGTALLHALNPSWPNKYLPVDASTEIIGVVTGQWRAF